MDPHTSPCGSYYRNDNMLESRTSLLPELLIKKTNQQVQMNNNNNECEQCKVSNEVISPISVFRNSP